ncbi:MAG TPA: epoxide hydrolase [Ilumatobacteraceae bacterium]|nr:epoxide hydrolase [Ilumatobacteraceae bacterium]
MSDMQQFSIHFDPQHVDDLHDRLRRTRWPEAATVDDWSQGVPLTYLRELCDYWANDYDVDAAEDRLNAVPHFLHSIDGLDVHFVHVRSEHPDAMPVVLTHGWPGSFVEFLGVVEALVNPSDPADAFHVVIPSLPGYGFSAKPTKPGWGIERIAHAWDTLMTELGYRRYAVQGGDWGAMVSTRIAQLHPDHVVGAHLNMPVVAIDPATLTDLTADEQAWLARMADHRRWGRGYSEEQSTRPQTIGYGLIDSPVAQCAWIVEKFWAWTDNRGHPEDALSKQQMLDNISVYWFTASAASSARLYWESLNSVNLDPVEVPTGVSVFPKEIFPLSRRWCEQRFTDLRYYNVVARGGHFAAFEQPALFVDELRACFRGLR